MSDLGDFFSNVDAATQPRGKGKLMRPEKIPGAPEDLPWADMARAVAPATTSLAMGEPQAPMQSLPDTPQKVPSTADRRYGDAAMELLPLAVPGGAPGMGARTGMSMAARLAPRAVRLAPAAGESSVMNMARDAAGGLAAGALAPTGEAQAQSQDEVRALQTRLKATKDPETGLPLYNGTIDGKRGGDTRAAEARMIAIEEARKEQDRRDAAQLEREKVQASLGASNATRAEAEARVRETERLRLAGEEKARQRDVGIKRLKEVEDNLPPMDRAIRENSGLAGYGLGTLMGGAFRGMVVKGSNALSARRASRAEALYSVPGSEGPTKVAAKTPPDKVSRVNEFVRKGGGQEPFEITPQQNPGYAANPNATPMRELYQPSRTKNAATDLGVLGAFGAEAGLGELKFNPDAQEALHAATAAANDDMSEVNIQQLQKAKNDVAKWEGVSNIGRGGAGGYLATAAKIKRAPSVPNMAPAEAEKMSLEATLRKLAPKAGKGPSTPKMPKAAKPTKGAPPDLNGPDTWTLN